MQSRFEELKQNLLPRFWDTENKKMLYPKKMFDGIVYYIDGIVHYKDDNHTLSMLLSLPQFIHMKPTGLKDKKGNLIYENDFVRMCGLTDVYIIKWVQESCEFIAQYTKNSNIIKHWYDIKGFEIIGNIHSNPELLEVQK